MKPLDFNVNITQNKDNFGVGAGTLIHDKGIIAQYLKSSALSRIALAQILALLLSASCFSFFL